MCGTTTLAPMKEHAVSEEAPGPGSDTPSDTSSENRDEEPGMVNTTRRHTHTHTHTRPPAQRDDKSALTPYGPPHKETG